jgi:hypothetical protein
VEHTIAIESNEDVLAFCCDQDWGVWTDSDHDTL